MILASILDKEKSPLDSPSQKDWDEVGKKFNCRFNDAHFRQNKKTP